MNERLRRPINLRFEQVEMAYKRIDSEDAAFLKLSELAFEEWNRPEDEAVFRDL